MGLSGRSHMNYYHITKFNKTSTLIMICCSTIKCTSRYAKQSEEIAKADALPKPLKGIIIILETQPTCQLHSTIIHASYCV